MSYPGASRPTINIKDKPHFVVSAHDCELGNFFGFADQVAWGIGVLVGRVDMKLYAMPWHKVALF
ncbi:hypothetical protein WMF22_07420 [Sorangium sp. So ce204]